MKCRVKAAELDYYFYSEIKRFYQEHCGSDVKMFYFSKILLALNNKIIDPEPHFLTTTGASISPGDVLVVGQSIVVCTEEMFHEYYEIVDQSLKVFTSHPGLTLPPLFLKEKVK